MTTKKFEWTDEAVAIFCKVYTNSLGSVDGQRFPYQNYRGKKMPQKMEQFKKDWVDGGKPGVDQFIDNLRQEIEQRIKEYMT